ncbi:MAG: bifunctional phosphopantothenoylcysteine decarboxylase/phosphopantothenate--cysteine ligase CoaBC [Acidilobaceae archaeon]|nr:bifunctional phosphopantothenoylcysteine decarboxylase/phosphopantothenate--cysteine ligase CoaBC [Acidilobaceae archaeon]
MISPHHPSRNIVGSVNRYLEGHTIILGITASVSSYKSVDTARWLMRRGAIVVPAMTQEATKYVGPTLLHWATGVEPIVELGGETEHVGLVGKASSVVVAPATLSTMAKVAHGIGDTSVSMIAISAIGYGKKVMFVPAMHDNLYGTAQYAKAKALLEEMGAKVLPPLLEEGAAKYPSPDLVGRVAAAFTSRGEDLKGMRVLVTGGPTREWIDRVRFISNPSSGLMGVEVAVEAWSRGASVDFVHGPLAVKVPHFLNSYRVETAAEMAERVAQLTEKNSYDVAVFAAAPADFAPAEIYEGKIRSGRELSLLLKPTPKVLASMRSRPKAVIAFAAESTLEEEKLLEAAREKLSKYSADVVVANAVGYPGTGFGSETNRVILVTRDQNRNLGTVHKEVLARLIIDEAVKLARGSR